MSLISHSQAFELAYSVKISNLEAHADMHTQQSPCQSNLCPPFPCPHITFLTMRGMGGRRTCHPVTAKGMHHCCRHIPRTSTVARFLLSCSKCSKFGVQKVKRSSKRLLIYVLRFCPCEPEALLVTDPGEAASAWQTMRGGCPGKIFANLNIPSDLSNDM